MDLWDEVGCSLDETWGTDTEEWKEICVFENMMHVIARASNRVFVGLPLCRNEAYLKSVGSFAQDVNVATILMRFVPKILEPVLGRIIAMPNNHHYRQSAVLHLPLIKERLVNMAQKGSNPSYDWEEPNDYLSWHIRTAQKEGNTVELDPQMIGRRLMPINYGAIHTTVFTITNTLFDILSVPTNGTETSPMEMIREESLNEYQSCEGNWSKASLSHLIHTDSAIRESMRLSNFLTRGLRRKVVAKDGVENKRMGWKLPFGSTVAVDVYSIMHDSQIYANADSYDPFRFARQREQEEAASKLRTPSSNRETIPGRETRTALESKQLSLNSTSGTFLPFGHGRHACPGRFLVAHELKMLLAYATMFYEIEPLESRPANVWFGQHVIPPMKATIRVRRRRAENVGF